MTDMERLRILFEKFGIEYSLTDDSEESTLEENLETVVDLFDQDSTTHVLFIFRRNGSFKDWHTF